MSTAPSLQPAAESPVNGFARHIEELQEYFRSRGVPFGSAEDLRPFVERVDSDASFRDDLASMTRAIIYRERDGLSRPELIELLTTAAAGPQAENATSSETRACVRKLMTFVEGVFRTRWNPGAAVGGPAPRLVRQQPEETAQEQEIAPQPAPAVHPTTDLFYRAQVVANGGVAETLAQERKIESVPESKPPAAESVDPEEFPSDGEQWHIPLEDFAGSEPERGSRAWLWIAAICALLLAFSAGLFMHQRMLVPLRDASQPYEASPQETAAAQPPAAAPVRPAHQPAGTTVDSDWRARATKVRRVPAYVAAEPAIEPNLEPRFMGPATIGASPALMASRLVYAPPARYPKLAKMTHVQGKVLVQAVVGKNGRVIRAQAISGHHLLRGAAVHEVYGRRYRPYLLDDRARDVATIVTVDFRLR